MVTITIHHYNRYLWGTLNVTTTPILSATPLLVMFNFLVTQDKVYHHFSYEMVNITIGHYKSLLVMDLQCHHNTYTFGDATFGDVQFLVTEVLLTFANELMVTFFDPHQCPFSLVAKLCIPLVVFAFIYWWHGGDWLKERFGSSMSMVRWHVEVQK